MKVLSQSGELAQLVRKEDENIFRRIVQYSSNDNGEPHSDNVRYLTDDFKNSLIVRCALRISFVISLLSDLVS